MKRHYGKLMKDLQDQALVTKGEEFTLDAQINIMKMQNQQLTMQKTEYKERSSKQEYDLQKENEKTQKSRMEIEADLRKISAELEKALKEHYEHFMKQEEEKKQEEEYKERYDLEMDELNKLKAKKLELEAKAKGDVDQVEQDFKNWNDFQANLEE